MQKIDEKTLLPAAGVLGANAVIEFIITGSLKGTPQFGLQAADGIALAAQAVTSGLAWKLYGPIPGIIGLLEAIVFVGVKLASTPSLPPLPPKPAGAGNPLTSAASSLINTAESIPGAKSFFQKVGIAGVVMGQMN